MTAGAPGAETGTGSAVEPDDLARIGEALEVARGLLFPFIGTEFAVDRKGSDPVTAADRLVDTRLRNLLPRSGEAWLSEESEDDRARLGARRVWVVDPLDGTQEFIDGIPEWCVSVGLVVDGRPVAGGICNPATGETIVGAVGFGVTLDGTAVRPGARPQLAGAVVLASRSETRRGEWQRFAQREFSVRPMGSVAYKLALVAAGRADATWTLVPKHEWDVAAGAALVLAGGGELFTQEGRAPVFNQPHPRLTGLVATRAGLGPAVRTLLGIPD